LVECPQPLASLLSGRLASADPAMRKLILEALTWRYYRIRNLANFRSLEVDGQCYASAEYDYEGKRIHVFTTHAQYPQLSEAARTLFPLIAEVPADHDVVIDFYVLHSGWLGDSELMQQQVCSVLNQTGFPRPIRRILVTVAVPGQGHGLADRQHFTYRPSGNMYEEETFYR